MNSSEGFLYAPLLVETTSSSIRGIGHDRFFYLNRNGAQFSRFDLVKLTEESREDLPITPTDPYFFTFDKFIYLVDGGDVKVYDTNRDKWDDAGSMPNIDSYSFLVTGKKVWFTGGVTNGMKFGAWDLESESLIGS